MSTQVLVETQTVGDGQTSPPLDVNNPGTVSPTPFSTSGRSLVSGDTDTSGINTGISTVSLSSGIDTGISTTVSLSSGMDTRNTGNVSLTSGADSNGSGRNVMLVNNGPPFPYIHDNYMNRNGRFSLRRRFVRQHDKILKFLCLIIDNVGEGNCYFSLTLMHLNHDEVNDYLRQCQLTQWYINPSENLVIARWDIFLNLFASLNYIVEKQFYNLYGEGQIHYNAALVRLQKVLSDLGQMNRNDDLFFNFKFLVDGFNHFGDYYGNKTESISQLMGSLTKLERFGVEISIATEDMDTHFGQVIKDCWGHMCEEIDRATILFGETYLNEHVVHVLKHCRIEGWACSPNTSDLLGKELEKYLKNPMMFNSSYLWLGWKNGETVEKLECMKVVLSKARDIINNYFEEVLPGQEMPLIDDTSYKPALDTDNASHTREQADTPNSKLKITTTSTEKKRASVEAHQQKRQHR